MTVLGENIRRRIKELHTSQEEISRQVGISQAALNKIISGKSKTTGYLVPIASALNCTAEELLYGNNKGAISEPASKHNFGKVPLLSPETAGEWNNTESKNLLNSTTKYIFCPPSHGPSAYALHVEDDSMTSSQGKSYPQGSVIFVDPEQIVKITSGDQVIAKLKDFTDVVFRKYVSAGSKQYLQSLNPLYDPIHDEFEIIGRVIGKYEKE